MSGGAPNERPPGPPRHRSIFGVRRKPGKLSLAEYRARQGTEERTPPPQPSPSPPSTISPGSAVFSKDEQQPAPRQGRSNRRARSPSYSPPPPLEQQQTSKRTRRELDPNEPGPSRAQQRNADGRRTPLQARRQSLPPDRPEPNRGLQQRRIERPAPPASPDPQQLSPPASPDPQPLSPPASPIPQPLSPPASAERQEPLPLQPAAGRQRNHRRNRQVPEAVSRPERPQRARRQPDRFDPVPPMRPQGIQRRAQIRLPAPNQQLNMIPRAPMQRLIHEIADGLGPDAYRFQATSLEALRMSAEARIVELMEDANMCALHAKRVTIKIQDIQLAQLFYIKYNRV